MDDIRITGGREYVNVEYKGNIAHFGGEMCVDAFYAVLSSLSWIKRSKEITEDDLSELIEAVLKTNEKDKYKVFFCNDDGSVKYSYLKPDCEEKKKKKTLVQKIKDSLKKVWVWRD